MFYINSAEGYHIITDFVSVDVHPTPEERSATNEISGGTQSGSATVNNPVIQQRRLVNSKISEKFPEKFLLTEITLLIIHLILWIRLLQGRKLLPLLKFSDKRLPPPQLCLYTSL
ncbi:hypothetical protein WA026_002957 [Henosepilachna vigintioctopunctata]|uniref:Uncharacterized protein n=1 Tax=Henosepilachna vigintioctopunctata TaxID=420089 RepID=A0AAW1TNA6_9CUCU